MARELVNAKGTVPLRLVEMNPPDIGKSWREELCLFFVLWGEAEVIVCESRSLLKADDIIAINPNTVFEARSQECSALMLYIGVSALLDDKDCPMAFDCDSSKADDKARFFALKNLIATFLKENAGGAKNNAYFNGAIAYSLLLELQNSFLDVGKTASALKSAEQVQGVVREINERYREGITLKELAQSQNFSVSYFSIFFKRHFGVGFAEYYNSFRLERAVSELLSSEQPIETIARNHGFGDVRSFVSLFKKRYGMLPSAYRKEKASLTDSWRESEFESGIYGLSKYLTRPQKQTYLSMPESIEEKTLSAGKISILHGTPLKHTFRVFTSVGRAKELLYADVQNMLAGLQKEIGYQYIKFHGILSDDMLLYSESRGVPTYSFVMLDKALDFLMSIGLRPLVQFSFMPRKLATDLNLNVYFSPFNVSMPNDMGKWERLIKTVTEHFVQRYGICEVRQWLFCLWNEPNVNIFTPQGDEIIFELYRITRAAVKSVSKSLLFGMPSLVHVLTEAAWANRYFEMCRNFGCMPDFCNIHYYDNDISQGDIIPTYESLKEQDAWLKKTFKQNNDENAFRNAIPAFKALFEKNGAGSLPIYMTEWNMTISHRNLLNDTCFKACYLAKNILENYDALDSFGHWVLTDLIEETQPSNEHFHGGLGLLTHSGIKKASYHVFSFLNRLGDRLVAQGDGYFVTKSYRRVQIMLYNYEHFSHLFASGETFDMSFTKRYAPFLKLARLNVSLTLTDLPAKECEIRERILSWKNGSAFDAWVEMGARPLTPEDVEYLKQVSVPKMRARHEMVSDNELEILAELEPLEVRLVEVLY